MKKVIVLMLMLLLLGSYVFSRDESEETREFVRNGHGMNFYEDDMYDMDAFINNHGTPLKIEFTDITTDYEREIHEETIRYFLYYENIIVAFQKYSWRVSGEVYWNMYMYISSEQGHYLYDIYIGMPREAFFKALNMKDSGGDYLHFGFAAHVEIYFENQVLSKITWSDFSEVRDSRQS